MSRRSKFIIMAIVVLILLIAFLLIMLNRAGRRAAPSPSAPQDFTLPPPIPPLPTPAVIEPPPPGPQEQNPTVIAADFTERYGSYSNEGNYQNLRDLFPQMTNKLRAETEAFIAGNPLPSVSYQGTTTKVLRAELVAKTDTEARARLETQRFESTATETPARTFYQSAKLRLVKDDRRWLVDEFSWE
ncbi:hypothetical protein HY628_00300 [Candidatus Uhrbacteria bacterium]|nr:hypothetical protein [Candidatus Uhrbacteria bacterium]